ncbi:hypothetical protein E0494_02460 [Marinilabiliaceae bacterium JC040]|nr:hypothetical protein [Marinilabiliaceae bacterium JC040]
MTKRKRKIFICFLLFWVLCNIYHKYFTRDMIVGVYVNYNYQGDICIPGVPDVADTLYINKDGTFHNKYWGKGTYELETTHRGTSIDFNVSDGSGNMGMFLYFSRRYFGEPRIDLYLDTDHYYKKIK